MPAEYNFKTVSVTFPAPFVAHVQLNRPKKLNAIDHDMWFDIRNAFRTIRDDADVRAVVLSGAGRGFTSGIDYCLSAIERCDKAVIAAVHGACIGGGIDITTACDIRYASKDAFFSVKEVDVGLAADVGTLQRLPKVVGNISWVRELCLTARNFDAAEALEHGFISKILPDPAKVVEEAIATAKLIAEKSPVAAIGTKHLLNYSRDHSVQEGLDYTAAWNMVMLTTPDLPAAAAAAMQKQKATFAKFHVSLRRRWSKESNITVPTPPNRPPTPNMRQKTISRTSTFAWSPGQHAPLLATGTVAGAFDANFSNTSQLEIFDLNLADKSPEAMELNQPSGLVSSSARFNRLAWASPTVDRPYGIIAGGMENGELNLWDANAILSGRDDILFSKQTNHSGPVRGLHFNPFQQNLLASAASNGEVFIWDLGNLTKPYTPGSRSAKLEDITCVSWNNHVQHILATSSTTGFTVVWDLKSKREVLTLSYPGAVVGGMGSMGNLGQMGASRRGITAIAWNPDVATQIITATEDDNNPVILVWDLRYAHAPEKTLAGHTKGILSLSWCQQDSELLLSAGKDCRSLCWNPKSGEIIGELAPSSSWTFDIAWCPRNPDLLASASFDGKINVDSIQSTHDSESAAGHAVQESHDPFAPQQYQTQTAGATISLKQPPKWLRRPVGATFGFGGKLAIFRNRPAPPLNLQPGAVAPAGVPTNIPSVTLANVITEPEISQRAADLEYALETKTLDKFCEGRTQTSTSTSEYWTVLRALFEANPREQLVHHLGFDKQEMVDQVAALTRQMSINNDQAVTSPRQEGIQGGLQNHRASSAEMSALFTAAGGSDQQQFTEDAFGNYGAAPPVSNEFKQKSLSPFHIYPASDTDIDKKITRCIVAGDFDSAVNVCLHDGRLSDALVLAICGGPELLERTQKAYFERRAASTPYIRLLQSVVTGDLDDVVRNADLVDWQEIVVILCTFARPDEFGKLCESLGNRLEQQWISKVQAGEQSDQLRCNTVLCYLAAGNLERVVAIWIREQEEEIARNAYDQTASEYERNARSLQSFIEKVTVFRKAIDYVDVAIAGNPNEDQPEEQDGHYKLATLYDKYTEYAEIMASQGRLATAIEYLNLTPVDYQSKDTLAVLRDRLYHSGVDVSKVPAPEFPFEPVYVMAEGEYQQQQLYDQQQQQQQQYGQQQQQQQQQQYGQQNQYQQNQYQTNQYQANQYQPNQYQPQQPQNNYGATQNTYGVPAASPFGNTGYNAGGYQQQQPSIVPPPPAPFSVPPPPQQHEIRPPQPPVANNPYAPPAPTYGGFTQPAPPPAFNPAGYPGHNDQSPYGGYNQQQAPVERTRSAELPPSQRKDTGNWNDPPAMPLNNATKRPPAATTLNKAQLSSPFPGSPVVGNAPVGGTPPPQTNYGQPPPAGVPPPMAGARPPPPATSSPYSPVPAASHLPPPPQAGAAGAMSPRYANQRAQGPYQGNAAQPPNAYGQPPQHQQGYPQQQQQQQYQQQGYGQSTPSPGPFAPPQPGMGSGMPQVLQQRPLTPAAPPTPPEPAKSRHPAGDRTHIPAGHKLIYTVLASELAFARQHAQPAAKRPLDDAEKKLNVLFDMLNNEEVSGPVVDQMILLAQALQAKNYNSAYQIHLELHSTRTNEVSSWMTGVKRLIVDNAKIPQ
ncbi:protein transport protein S31 [Mortierella sp. GBA43]|nr:protein transport protein S31 [Mortierella sp. GBA43]